MAVSSERSNAGCSTSSLADTRARSGTQRSVVVTAAASEARDSCVHGGTPTSRSA